ncbi:histidine kinase, partial [Streptomyces sp. NPDC055058]
GGPARRTAPARGTPSAGTTGRPGGLAPLPRRVPQTSLAAELLEESAPEPEEAPAGDFTAERAASSLAGFQRGTFRARDDEDGHDGRTDDGTAGRAAGPPPDDTGPAAEHVPAAPPEFSTPPADR